MLLGGYYWVLETPKYYNGIITLYNMERLFCIDGRCDF